MKGIPPPGIRVDVSTGSGTAVVVCAICLPGWRAIVVGDRLAGLKVAADHEYAEHREQGRLTASAAHRLANLTNYRRKDS